MRDEIAADMEKNRHTTGRANKSRADIAATVQRNHKHTPKYWKYLPSGFIGTTEEDDQTIAYLSDHRNRKMRPPEETEANGRLIAAAPELLDVLEEMLIDYIIQNDGQEDRNTKRARKLLRRIDGPDNPIVPET